VKVGVAYTPNNVKVNQWAYSGLVKYSWAIFAHDRKYYSLEKASHQPDACH